MLICVCEEVSTIISRWCLDTTGMQGEPPKQNVAETSEEMLAFI